MLLGGITWYEGWRVSSVALTVLGITALLALIVLGYLVIARRNRPSSRRRGGGSPTEAPAHTEPATAPHVDHGASHGSSGGHDGGHGHGGGILSKLVTLVFLVVCGFGIYWFVQELQNIPPKTQHPIQVATGESKPLDTNPASYCKAPAPDATSYPAKPEEWTEVSVTPGGYEFCTNPGPASGLVEFECKMDEGGSWESCGQTFLFVRFKSKMPVTVWQESYHS